MGKGILYVLFLIGYVSLAQHSSAQVFPIYSKHKSIIEDQSETWVLWPFYSDQKTTDTRTVAVHPFFSKKWEHSTGKVSTDALWPFYMQRYVPEEGAEKKIDRNVVFPFFFRKRWYERGVESFVHVLFPLWLNSKYPDGGRAQILFPFFWYGKDVKIGFGITPPREMTFAAIFPLIGDIRGYYARDRILFFLWPLYVFSSQGRGDDYNEIHSILWPITGFYRGPEVKGFRLWPLVSYVKKEGEFNRAYFLWPLGHYREGRISRDNPGREKVFLFIPFYGYIKRPSFEFQMLFPLYGKLDIGKRKVRGYALGLYNQDYNYRTGIREDRYFWFIGRVRKPIPGFDPEEIDKDASQGGGIFPFYTRLESDRKVIKNVLWPLGRYFYHDYDGYSLTRKYFLPVYGNWRKDFDDGTTTQRKFFFPFFRAFEYEDGRKETKALQLAFFFYGPLLERNWGPLYTIFEKSTDEKRGTKEIRWFKEFFHFERAEDGTERKKVNLLFYEFESVRKPGEPKEGHTKLFWGLIGRHREPELKTELLWMKF